MLKKLASLAQSITGTSPTQIRNQQRVEQSTLAHDILQYLKQPYIGGDYRPYGTHTEPDSRGFFYTKANGSQIKLLVIKTRDSSEAPVQANITLQDVDSRRILRGSYRLPNIATHTDEKQLVSDIYKTLRQCVKDHRRFVNNQLHAAHATTARPGKESAPHSAGQRSLTEAT